MLGLVQARSKLGPSSVHGLGAPRKIARPSIEEADMIRTWLRAATLAVTAIVALPANGVAHDGPHKTWLENLRRPDNDRNPWREFKVAVLLWGSRHRQDEVQGREYRRSVPRGSMVRMARRIVDAHPTGKNPEGARPERRSFSLFTRPHHPVLRPAQRRLVNRGYFPRLPDRSRIDRHGGDARAQVIFEVVAQNPLSPDSPCRRGRGDRRASHLSRPVE